MRTTLNLDDDLVRRASELTRITEKTKLVHEALKALIEKRSRARLAALAGSAPDLERAPRRRPPRCASLWTRPSG